jgi:nucleotide-binding universal stress UspA family protein
VDVADELDASVIVTGSRGLAGVRSVLLGSVSNHVLHHAHRPTLIVPPASKA